MEVSDKCIPDINRAAELALLSLHSVEFIWNTSLLRLLCVICGLAFLPFNINGANWTLVRKAHGPFIPEKYMTCN